MAKRPKKRAPYTIDDLRAIAEQLGCRIQLQIAPLEWFQRTPELPVVPPPPGEEGGV
jgi:hypothetical protein